MIASHLCKFSDFGTAWYRDRLADLRECFLLHRKPWEWAVIAQAILESGLASAGKTGVGYAVGTESLPALFASWGATILATDQVPTEEASQIWSNGQLCAGKASLNGRGICPPEAFDERCDFRHVDMRAIPGDIGPYDFCWSSCSFEHLGTLELGLEFVIDSSRRLKPGGMAVHTTEFNVSSNDSTSTEGRTVLYRRRDIERLAPMLAEIGCTLEAVDWATGDHPIDSFVDETLPANPPFHLKLRLEGYVATSIVLVIRKAAS